MCNTNFFKVCLMPKDLNICIGILKRVKLLTCDPDCSNHKHLHFYRTFLFHHIKQWIAMKLNSCKLDCLFISLHFCRKEGYKPFTHTHTHLSIHLKVWNQIVYYTQFLLSGIKKIISKYWVDINLNILYSHTK
jgi:hypothetical protein